MVRIVGAFNNQVYLFLRKTHLNKVSMGEKRTKHTKITKTIRTENNPKDIYIKK